MIFDVGRAMEAQRRLAEMVVEEGLAGEPKRVCGLDVAYSGGRGFGAAVVLSYPKLEVLEVETAEADVSVPYIPTLLAFREMPVLFRLVRKIKMDPDVYMVDGHGVYHPRRCGLATHFGVVFKLPTIGVAKGRLNMKGSEIIGDSIVVNGRALGRILGRVYISVGNRVTLEDCVRIVSRCIRGHRVPEPLFLAHRISKEVAMLGE
ncbi:MAG: endonuclease V [Candidatus Methanomethyliales bacterium]|nr:endonuclease V [Candidatus Methanomethylicales archaeon]